MAGEILDKPMGIQKFFEGTTVFITGATGFLGHILLTKLLRSCPGIRTIYILVRQKKSLSASQRFEQLFSVEILDKVKKNCPDYRNKVKLMIGDCEKPGLALKESDLSILVNEVDIIFHVAATVKFNAPLRDAVNMNIKCTRDLLDIVSTSTKLKVLVYVSTVFSNCVNRKTIEERFYDQSISAEKLIATVDALDDYSLSLISPYLLGQCPNTYVFSKAIAEDLCRSERYSHLPLAVFRPGIVTSTAKEPIPGWLNNVYGPTGIVAAAGLGLLRSMHVDKDCTAHIVPCDYVINALIASAWETGTKWRHPEKLMGTNGRCNTTTTNGLPKVYNYTGNCVDQPLTWGEFLEGNEFHEPELAFHNAYGAYSFTLNKYRIVHRFYCLIFHLIPAYLVNCVAKLFRKQSDLIVKYEKIHQMVDAVSYFGTRNWSIPNCNINNLGESLSKEDGEIFCFDLKHIDWKEYFWHHVSGIRLYIAKDKAETIPIAKRRRIRLLLMHHLFSSLFATAFLYALYKIVRWFYYSIY